MAIDLNKKEEKLLIAGLGNIGERYQNTRHNAGFMFVDELTDQLFQKKYHLSTNSSDLYTITECSGQKKFLIKPHTMMNLSGKAVKKAMASNHIPLKGLIIVHDDLDLRVGEYKISIAKGPRTHNGISSIEDELQNKKFIRIRIGIENRTERVISGLDYVLMDFTQEELQLVKETIKKIIASEFII